MAQQQGKGLHIALWVVQGLLAAVFGMAGFMKLTAPIEQLAEGGMTFVNSYAPGTVRFIGISEVLGALGLILPAALRIKPVLTPLAAVGIGVILVLACGYHVSHGEPFIITVVFLALAAFVAWGRYKMAPIQPK
ncbi:MAG: DoxX family protein [Flavobacteriales bacterium]|nr:DoxX family protein [Flavobacteriales bacterium]